VSVIRLRYPARCAGCGEPLAAGARAWWDAAARTATCTGCRPSAGAAAPDAGEAGASAQHEYERRRRARAQRIERRWGRLAWLVRAVTREPRTTDAWAMGAGGERRVADVLSAALAGRGQVLNDRAVPGGPRNIDHIAVAPSGVWVVDAKVRSGRVRRRDVGPWWRRDRRLFVGSRDESGMAQGVAQQAQLVRSVLADPAIPVAAVLCFVGAEWGSFARPFRHDGVLVVWPRRLGRIVTQPGSLEAADVERIARRLAAALPPR
jgi:hypothetical protein